MKSAVENLSPTRVKLNIEVPSDELQPYVDAALKKIGGQIQIPGFRQGKVPSKIIEQRVGKGAVMQEAVNEALGDFFAQAVQENEVDPIGQPEVNIDEVPLEGSTQLKYTVEVDTRPEVTLPDYEGMQIEVDALAVSDEDVQARLTELRERFATLTEVDRAVQEGDFLTIDLSASVEGEEIDSVQDISYEVGSGTMLEGMDQALTGLKQGESKDFTAPLAGGEHAGQDADCTVTVKAVKVRELPEVDEEFVQMASEFDTVEQLQEDLHQQAEQAKRFEQGISARDKVLDKLMDETDIPLPESIVQEEINRHLEGEGRSEDDEHRAEVDESTRKALKTQFLLDAVVAAEEVEVGQPELVEYLITQAQQYGMDPNQFAQMIDSQGQVPAIMGEVARRKALAAVLDKATIVDTAGQEINLDDLVPGDNEADEAEVEQAEGDQTEAQDEQGGTQADEQD